MTKIASWLSLRIRDRITFPPSFCVAARLQKQGRWSVFPQCYVKLQTRAVKLGQARLRRDRKGAFTGGTPSKKATFASQVIE